nr:MAG TPA: Terminase [Bacteriophage sp.]
MSGGAFSLASKELINTVNQYDNFIKIHPIDESVISAYVEACKVAINGEKDIEYGLQLTKISKGIIEQFCMKQTGGTIWDLEKYAQEHNTPYDLIDKYYELLKLESYYNFESFMYYMERKRNWSKRFYYPRRKTLKVVVNDLEDLENRKIKFYGLSMPSRVGKSTICIFFLAWVAMRRPNSHSAMGGHSGILAKGFYKELINLFSTEEYAFDELFFFWNPEYANKSLVTDKSADEFTITLGDPDRFATVTCRGIDGTWTGAVDVSKDGYLYVDDLVRDREHSLSPTRMENTYQEYLNKMVDRKNDGARELMVGTLWNVLDPLERLRKSYDGNPEYRFRRIPALDENDESNFDYEINGFSTAYYRDMREKLDKAEWEAKFMQRPFVREGLLFPTDELRYFNGILPDGDFRRIGVVDVAWGGGDSLSMPIGAEYDNGDVYIYDWVFNKGAKEVTLPLVVGRIIGNGIRQTRFEGNTGGELYCQYVDERLQDQKYKCSCTSRKAPNKVEKLSKIIAYSGDIKRKFIFLESKKVTQDQLQKDAELGVVRYRRNDEYQAAMDELTMFVSIGENKHDDAADGLTQLEMFIENPNNLATATATENPFRTGGY